jgi:lysophospholipase L1-like esterase
MTRPARRFSAKVVGVTFVDEYPDNLLALAEIQRRREDRGFDEPLAAVLIRNPDNAYDTNAIEVHVPSEGMIGHLPKEIAARLAPCLDAGETWHATLSEVRISPEAPEQPGVDVHVERIKHRETDEEGDSRYELYLDGEPRG